MKFRVAIILAVVFITGQSLAFAANGKQIFDAYKAKEQTFESTAKNVVITQTLEGQGMSADMTVYKKGSKMRMESVVKMGGNPMMGKAGDKSIMINDGKTMWSFSPMMGKVTTPSDSMEGETRAPEKVKALGKETVSGVSCWKIEVVYPYDEKETLWISEKDAILIKEERGDEEGQTTVVYSDIKTVKGFPIAHLITTSEDGQVTDTVRITSLEVNKKIDDTLFNPDLVKGYGKGKSAGMGDNPMNQGGAMEMMQMSMEIQRLYQNGEVEKAKALEKKMQSMMQ
ncbi:MAG: outer membrane lipoprotein-sorting protein [Proteobacteria bacterium]|nr:outer membrane lipoprotein-sorting protein [Pseudomonadota bacterium]